MKRSSPDSTTPAIGASTWPLLVNSHTPPQVAGAGGAGGGGEGGGKEEEEEEEETWSVAWRRVQQVSCIAPCPPHLTLPSALPPTLAPPTPHYAA
eukprot:1314276-Rhodomonas_salina.1